VLYLRIFPPLIAHSEAGGADARAGAGDADNTGAEAQANGATASSSATAEPNVEELAADILASYLAVPVEVKVEGEDDKTKYTRASLRDRCKHMLSAVTGMWSLFSCSICVLSCLT
jgi:hypothetical protein